MHAVIRLRPARYWAPSLLLLLMCSRLALAAEADSTRADSLPTPRAALLRSAVLPGWGQHYNGRPLKALFFAGASATALSAVIAAHRTIDAAPTPETHANRAARRNTRLLYFALSVALSAIDAYVDAQLADFEADIGMEMRRDGASLTLKMTLPTGD